MRALTTFTLIFFASIASVSGQSPEASRPISSADLKDDVAVLRRAYEQIHPGLYRYNTKQQIDRNFALLEAEFNRDRSLSEAYLAFSKFLAKIKCGHSYAKFYHQPKAIATALFKNKDKLPFHFRWLDGRMIVVRSFAGNSQLTPGSEIVAINGISPKVILKTLMTIARADGSNDAKRIASLEVLGSDKYETFDIFFPLLFPQRTSKFELTVKPFGLSGKVKLSVDAMTYDQRLTVMPSPAESVKADGRVFDFTYLDSQTALLRMPTWALFNSKWNWKKFIDESMDESIAKNVTDIIIDIRDNEGGIDVGDAIISRLIDRDLSQSKTSRLVRYRKAPADLIPYLDTWDRSFDDWGAAAVERTDGFFTLKKYNDDDKGIIIRPSGERFTGRVYILVGATNSSATFQFAQTIKQNRLGTLVGQPTGGNQRGINGGAFYFLRLPKSKIEIDLPLIGQYPIVSVPDAGIEPDIYVKPRVADIANGIDTEIEAVKRLIKKK